MKTSSTNKKIREIISMVKEGKLLPRPEFQRRLVWTRDDKNLFLDSILRGYPFPEVYLADGDVDLETGRGTQLLVDGLQRVSTITQYFNGDSDLTLTTVPPYKDLPEEEKKNFLQYDVSVRDLGAISRETIIEIFQRINATKYSLLDIEINNAVYVGALKKFAERVADDDFFKERSIFTASDYKRMGDLRFSLLVIGTLIEGYFNRDDAFEYLLDRFNDDFPLEKKIWSRLSNVFRFIEECGFDPKSRIWRKADLFTALIEVDRVLSKGGATLDPARALKDINEFFERLEKGNLDQRTPEGVYYKAALQASNDRVNRVRRGIIVAGVLERKDREKVISELDEMGLI